MDLVQFSEIINHDNLTRNMKMYFDEHIAMYNIINNYNIGTDISAQQDGASIMYTVLPKSGYDADKLLEVLSNAVISIYQHCYNIDACKLGNTIVIHLKKTSSL